MPSRRPNDGVLPSPPGPGKALRVLIVEDDAVLAELLAELLMEMGYDVCAIEATEADAVAAANRYRPDLMIVDAQLGVGSGLAAMETILRTGFVPHIFVSGDPLRSRVLEQGAVILQKPFLEAALVHAIQRALAAVPAS